MNDLGGEDCVKNPQMAEITSQEFKVLEAVAVEETRCLIVGAAKFQNLMTEHPILMSNILGMLGRSLDSANSLLLDFMDKKVENRILRVLNTLYIKFGFPVNFTSREISEIAGTTQASVLRTMGELRRQGVISGGRGRIWIKDEKGLKPCEFGQIIICSPRQHHPRAARPGSLWWTGPGYLAGTSPQTGQGQKGPQGAF